MSPTPLVLEKKTSLGHVHTSFSKLERWHSISTVAKILGYAWASLHRIGALKLWHATVTSRIGVLATS
jgi:hypothetical protein